MSESLRSAYVRVLGKAWDDYEYRDKPESYDQAKKAVKAIWRMHFKRRFPYSCRETSGIGDTWVNRRVCCINPDQSWIDLNHTWSHWCSYCAGNRKPHCDRHLEMERLGAELIKRRFCPKPE